VQKIDVTIAKLRLLLADISAKEQQHTAMLRQFREQQRRAVEYGIYGDNSLEGTLGLMDEIRQRMTATEATLGDLGLIRSRAERELESLQLTRRIEAARTELQTLLTRQRELEDGNDDRSERTELAGQIRELQQQINEASEHAARTISRR